MTSFSRALPASALTALLMLASACGSVEDRAETPPHATPVASPSAEPQASTTPPAPGTSEKSLSPSAGQAASPSAGTSRSKPAATPSAARAPRPTAPAEPRTTTAPKPAATSGVGAETGIRSAVYAQHSATRSANGLGKLTTNSCLQRYADSHAKKLATAAGGLSHQNLKPILNGCSMTTVGENVAAGQTSAAAAQKAWLNSSGHKANILKAEHNRMGAAVYRAGDGRLYYVVVFGRG